MYISTFTPLQTALSGVEAAQQELDTTGNNIANAEHGRLHRGVGRTW